jgi:methionine synthase II (cobalamin-independent)
MGDRITTTHVGSLPRSAAVAEVQVVGRERVMAGTDCGFGTFGGFGPVEPDIAYLKLSSLVEGAQIASSRRWR